MCYPEEACLIKCPGMMAWLSLTNTGLRCSAFFFNYKFKLIFMI